MVCIRYPGSMEKRARRLDHTRWLDVVHAAEMPLRTACRCRSPCRGGRRVRGVRRRCSVVRVGRNRTAAQSVRTLQPADACETAARCISPVSLVSTIAQRSMAAAVSSSVQCPAVLITGVVGVAARICCRDLFAPARALAVRSEEQYGQPAFQCERGGCRGEALRVPHLRCMARRRADAHGLLRCREASGGENRRCGRRRSRRRDEDLRARSVVDDAIRCQGLDVPLMHRQCAAREPVDVEVCVDEHEAGDPAFAVAQHRCRTERQEPAAEIVVHVEDHVVAGRTDLRADAPQLIEIHCPWEGSGSA